MNNYANIRERGFEDHYYLWLESHPDAISHDTLYELVESGDQYGKPVSATVLAELCKTTKNTMLKWLPIIKEELKESK